MNKIFRMKLIALGLLAGLSSAFAGPSETDDKLILKACMANAKSECTSWLKGGGSGEFPRGLVGQATAELADGETYILSGVIQIISAQNVNLKIDLKEFPWLASKAMKKYPVYRIDDSVARWKKYDGQKIDVLVTARTAVWTDNANHYVVEIYLEPTASPVIELSDDWKIQRNSSSANLCR